MQHLFFISHCNFTRIGFHELITKNIKNIKFVHFNEPCEIKNYFFQHPKSCHKSIIVVDMFAQSRFYFVQQLINLWYIRRLMFHDNLIKKMPLILISKTNIDSCFKLLDYTSSAKQIIKQITQAFNNPDLYIHKKTPQRRLTTKQQNLLSLLLKSSNASFIANAMNISTRAVSNNRGLLIQKIGIKNRNDFAYIKNNDLKKLYF